MVLPTPIASRVLIADDSVVCRGVLVILLENEGYEVVSVLDGNEALKALRDHPFDLAILDNDMPNLGGIGALTELRRFLPDLPVVVCSGTVSSAEAVRYRELGIDDLLSKPVDPRTLREKIAAILSSRGNGSAVIAPVSGDSFSAARLSKPVVGGAAPCPLVAGTSKFARQLQTDTARLREFRSVAIIEGRHGSGRFELALSAADPDNAHRFVCHADELTATHLDTLLKPAHADARPTLLVVLEADRLPVEQQTLLEDLVRGRVASQAPLAGRLRLVLCAQQSLCDLHFNEFLLLRAVTATYQVPDFNDRWQDWAEIARAILRRAGSGRGTLSPEAAKWIDRHLWAGDYMQLHRTVELARRIAGVTTLINDAHLAAAFAKEPHCDEPLFHDLLFHLHSGDE